MSASDKKKLRKEQETAALTEKQKVQKNADKQLKNYTMTFIVVMILVVAIAVVSVGTNWYTNSGIPAHNTVALTIGDTELSNVDMNYYYIDTINEFYNDLYDQYQDYTSFYAYYMHGLDMTAPLNTQIYDEATNQTWADHFVESAIENVSTTYALYNAAIKDGAEVTEEIQTQVDTAVSYAAYLAAYGRYASLDAYLKSLYGNGASEESYRKYYTVNAIAEAYYTDYAEALTYTDEEIDTYNQENYDDFSSFDYTYFYVAASRYLPEKKAEATDSTDSTDPTASSKVEYSAAELIAAATAAKADADALAKATDADNFNELIDQLSWATDSTDATSNKNTAISSVATLYSEWLAEADRQEGDISVFEYESGTDSDEAVDGYYVVMFEGRRDFNEMMRSVRHILVKFEGGTKGEDGNTVYSDAEKKKAYDEAQALYQQWLNGETVDQDSFAKLCTTETSDDTGSSSNGGLYTNIYEGQMVANFNDWVFDESRKPGDHEIIETEIGYHIMYFVEVQDQSYREYCIDYTLRNTDATEWYQELQKGISVTEGDTSYLSKNLILTPASTT